VVIWYIVWPFWYTYIHFGAFFTFWYVAAIKIWQPWFAAKEGTERKPSPDGLQTECVDGEAWYTISADGAPTPRAKKNAAAACRTVRPDLGAVLGFRVARFYKPKWEKSTETATKMTNCNKKYQN
jgi:hypothetical protein